MFSSRLSLEFWGNGEGAWTSFSWGFNQGCSGVLKQIFTTVIKEVAVL